MYDLKAIFNAFNSNCSYDVFLNLVIILEIIYIVCLKQLAIFLSSHFLLQNYSNQLFVICRDTNRFS